MVTMDIRLDPSMTQFLRSMLQGIFESLQEKGKVRGYSPSDEDDQDIWVDALQGDNLESLEALMSVVKMEKFGCEPLQLPLDEMMAMIRACSCLRLHLRETVLEHLSDQFLESGIMNLRKVGAAEHDAYIVFTLLAYIQSRAIESVD